MYLRCCDEVLKGKLHRIQSVTVYFVMLLIESYLVNVNVGRVIGYRLWTGLDFELKSPHNIMGTFGFNWF